MNNKCPVSPNSFCKWKFSIALFMVFLWVMSYSQLQLNVFCLDETKFIQIINIKALSSTVYNILMHSSSCYSFDNNIIVKYSEGVYSCMLCCSFGKLGFTKILMLRIANYRTNIITVLTIQYYNCKSKS